MIYIAGFVASQRWALVFLEHCSSRRSTCWMARQRSGVLVVEKNEVLVERRAPVSWWQVSQR